MSTRLALHSTDGNETLREGKGPGPESGPGADGVLVTTFWHRIRRSQRILNLNSAFQVVTKIHLSTEVDRIALLIVAP